LTLADLDRLSKETRTKIKTLRQPDAMRGHAANYWYEVRLQGAMLEPLRRILFREHHPVEKVQRIALGPLTLEGLPRGRYRALEKQELESLMKPSKPSKPPSR